MHLIAPGGAVPGAPGFVFLELPSGSLCSTGVGCARRPFTPVDLHLLVVAPSMLQPAASSSGRTPRLDDASFAFFRRWCCRMCGRVHKGDSHARSHLQACKAVKAADLRPRIRVFEGSAGGSGRRADDDASGHLGANGNATSTGAAGTGLNSRGSTSLSAPKRTSTPSAAVSGSGRFGATADSDSDPDSGADSNCPATTSSNHSSTSSDTVTSSSDSGSLASGHSGSKRLRALHNRIRGKSRLGSRAAAEDGRATKGDSAAFASLKAAVPVPLLKSKGKGIASHAASMLDALLPHQRVHGAQDPKNPSMRLCDLSKAPRALEELGHLLIVPTVGEAASASAAGASGGYAFAFKLAGNSRAREWCCRRCGKRTFTDGHARDHYEKFHDAGPEADYGGASNAMKQRASGSSSASASLSREARSLARKLKDSSDNSDSSDGDDGSEL